MKEHEYYGGAEKDPYIEYPIILRRNNAVVKVRVVRELTLADVEQIADHLRTVAVDAPIPDNAAAW